MSLLNVPFVRFPSVLSLPTASSSKRQPNPWQGVVAKAQARPLAGVSLAEWLTQTRHRFRAQARQLLQLHGSGAHADQYPWQPPQFPVPRRRHHIPTSPEGFPNSRASSSSKQAAASRVPPMFGPSSLWKQGACHVSSRSGLQETGAELDRESVGATIFSSQSKGKKRDRDTNVVHSLKDKENLQKIFERKVDLAVQGERAAQQKKFEAEAKVDARNWEKRNSDIAFREINQEFESQRYQLQQAACMENWNWGIDSSKKIMQGIAKKLKSWGECVAKKLTKQDKQELSKFLVRSTIILRSWIREQIWSDPRPWWNFNDSESKDHALPRFWIAAKYTELYGYYGKRFWTTTCSRRTTLHILPQFKEFGIFLTGSGTWYCRYSKEKGEWNEKRIVEYADSIASLPKQKWNVEPYWWNLFSLIIQELLLRNWILENFLSPCNFKAGRLTSELRLVWKQPILKSQCSGSKKLRSQNQLTNLRHHDRLWCELISLTSICLMRCLRPRWRRFSSRRYPSEKEYVSKSSALKNTTGSYEEHNLRYVIYEFFHAAGACEAVQGLSDLFTMSLQNDDVQDFDVRWDHCTINSKRNPFRRDPGRFGPCMIKKLHETMENLPINNKKLQWNIIWEIEISESEMMLWNEDQLPRVKKETKPTLRGKWESFQWKAHGQCSTGDSGSFCHDLPASGNKGEGQRRKGQSSSPASHSKAKQTDGEEQKSSQGSGNKQENLKDGMLRLCEISSKTQCF